MENNSQILFDDIHTQDKQSRLEDQFELVSSFIHKNFNKLSKVDQCPCCNSKDIESYMVKFGFNLDRCAQCTHIFTNPFPSPEALNYFYNSDYKKFENQFFSDSFEKRIPIFTYRLSKIDTYLKGNQSILDIGSSLGIFLEANKRAKLNLSITSCDISSDACNLLKSKFPDQNIINSDFLDLPENQKFNCVTLWDTFEHLTDPGTCLTKVRSLLDEDGIFAFSTPNTISAEWVFAGRKHPQLLPPGHVNLYNTSNVKIILDKYGFKVESIMTPNASLDISFIKKILNGSDYKDRQNKADKYGYCPNELIIHLLNIKGFEEALEELIKTSGFAGNMFVIARKV